MEKLIYRIHLLVTNLLALSCTGYIKCEPAPVLHGPIQGYRQGPAESGGPGGPGAGGSPGAAGRPGGSGGDGGPGEAGGPGGPGGPGGGGQQGGAQGPGGSMVPGGRPAIPGAFEQNPGVPGIPESLLDRFLKKQTGHKETILEPYWFEGEWVFNRKLVTRKPKYNVLYTASRPHRECNQICPIIYENYGKVCAQRMNNYWWRYDYKEFGNMCFLELENCIEQSKP